MNRAELVLTSLMTAAAVVIAGVVTARTFTDVDAPRSAATAARTSVGADIWAELLEKGRPLSPSGGSVQLVVFGDFECPACRQFHQTLREVERGNRGILEVRMLHLPLPYHRFAQPAARMAECAEREDRFSEMADALYDAQDSLGLLSWEVLAARAGSPNPESLARCATLTGETADFRRITDGLRLATAVGATGTPTVLIDGVLIRPAPDVSELRRIAQAALRR